MLLLLHVSSATAQPVELREARRVTAAGDSAQIALPDFYEPADAAQLGTHARYELTLTLASVPRRPAIYLPALIANVRLVVNGHVVIEAPDHPRELPPRGVGRIRLIELPTEFLRVGANRIVFEASGASFVSLSRVWFGDRQALGPRYQARVMARIVGPAIVALLMGALALVVLLLWARQRDALYGYFGAGALAWALQNAWTLVPIVLLEGVHFIVWWTSLFSFFAAMLTIFSLRFAGRLWPRFERVLWGLSLSAPLLLYAAHGVNLFDEVREVWPFIWYGANLVAIAALGQYAWRKRGASSVLLLLCGLTSFAFAVHDWLVIHDDSDNAPVYLLPYAGLLFVALMTWLLIDRFVRASRNLAALNSELEARVAAKSAELHGVLEQMREARDIALAANRAKSSFLAAASHDLRQPIHALGLYMSALQGDALTRKQRDMLRSMSDSHEALSSMFDALLDISRMDAGAVIPHCGVFEPGRLLRRIADDSQPLARDKRLRLRLRLSPALQRLRAASDPLLVERIVRNLLGNAVKYTRRGGVLLSCRWRRGDASSAPGHWLIEVWDTGVGIAPAEQERVFEEFYQIGNPHRDRAGGLGLGLSIVRRLAGMLELPLELRSLPGRGTRFRLMLPATFEAPPAEAPMPALGDMHGLGVAVIDDDPEVRRAMQSLLERWGCRVFAGEHAEAVLLAAADGVARLPDDEVGDEVGDQAKVKPATWLKAAAPAGSAISVVIADYQLRDQRNGIDEIGALRLACGAELPAVIISADSAPDRLALIQRSGFDYLSKPVAPARLRSWLNQAARARR